MPRNPPVRRSVHPSVDRRAYSLVEVVAAIGLMAATLVPALRLVRDGMEQSAETDQRQLLALYAASQIEQQLGATAMSWTNASFSGDYSADGHADIRYATVCSDDPLNGGIVDSLMSVSTTVYYDENQDDALTAGELRCSYETKIGKLATYIAQGS